MVAVYFAHSYREEDSAINKYFLNLMQDNGIMPSVDVPSNRLNAAKLERQFGFTSGLVCVLPNRENGPSAYIQSEIWMALRSGKPTLVFSEDTIPDNSLPDRIIKDRFSRKSYWRSTRDHLEKIESFLAFTGKVLLPSLRATDRKRSAVLLGLSRLNTKMRDNLVQTALMRDYAVIIPEELPGSETSHLPAYAAIRDASFVLANVDGLTSHDAYLLGYARGAVVPTIKIKFDPTDDSFGGVPAELGPRLVSMDPKHAIDALNTEIDIFEDEAFEIDQQGEIESYIEFLKGASKSRDGYDAALRNVFIQQNRDIYNVGQAGAAGPSSSNTNMKKPN